MPTPEQPFSNFEDLPDDLQRLLRGQFEQQGQNLNDDQMSGIQDELARQKATQEEAQRQQQQSQTARPPGWGSPMNAEQKADLQAELERRREARRARLEEMRGLTSKQPPAAAPESQRRPQTAEQALDDVMETALRALPEHLQEQARSFFEERRDYRPPSDEQLQRQLAGYGDDELRHEWELLLNQRKTAMDVRAEEAARAIGMRLQRVYEAMRSRGFSDEELTQRVQQWGFETIAEKQLAPDWAAHSGSAMPIKQSSYRLYANDYAVEFSTFLLGDGRWVLGTPSGTYFNIAEQDEGLLLAWARQFFFLLCHWLKIAGTPTRHYLPDLTMEEYHWRPTTVGDESGYQPLDPTADDDTGDWGESDE